METMKLPRLDPATHTLYDAALPKDPRVQTRAMFGGLGSFVNGNMFSGALGDRIFLRLSEDELKRLLREPGAGPFEPVRGHAKAGYATVPRPWASQPEKVRQWMARSFEWVASLPPKAAKTKPTSRK
jgi:TfoX/Sxy family transcriptional regulator of competence genes